MKRKLRVEEHNASFGKIPASTIRLKGHWLRKLGFAPGASVELTAISPGVLEIRLCGVAPVHHAISLDEARKAGEVAK